MRDRNSWNLRPADVLVALGTIVVLSMLVAPSLAQSRTDSRLAQCLHNLKGMLLGLINHESARAYFPAASTAGITGKPGSVGDSGEAAGYSWLAQTLPYMEMQPLYTEMRDASQKFTLSPFDDAVRSKGGGKRRIANQRIDRFVCPGFEGGPAVDVEASDYQSDEAAGSAPAITNYFASSSTHLVKREDGWRLSDDPKAIIQGNGAIPLFSEEGLESHGFNRIRGVTFAAISRDGTSNTFLICEGREQAYSAWIDGQVAWTVAAWPGNPQAPALLKDPAYPNASAVLRWEDAGQAQNTICIAKQPHGAVGEAAGIYLPAEMWSGTMARRFGRSGNHPDVAAHGFADGHSKMIANDIDPVVYLHLTTRSGGEVIPEAVRQQVQAR